MLLLLQTTLSSNLLPRALFPGFYGKAPCWGRGCSGPRLTAVNVGVPKCVTKQRSRDTARSSVRVIVFQMCRSLNCEERLPLLVSRLSNSVFWGVSSTEVVLFPVNSSTRKKLRLLCVGVTFVISSSRYERTKTQKTLGKFVILTNEVHKRRNENQSPWQICRKKLLGVTSDEHLKFTSHLDELSKRVSRKIGVMMRLKNVIPTFSRGWNLQIFGFATNKDGMALL